MQTERTDLQTQQEEEGAGGMNGESSVETYTLPCVKQRVSGNLLNDSGNSNWGSGTTERGGREWEVGGGDISTPMADSCCRRAETNTIL